MLGQHYMSQKPDKARDRGFVESIIGSINKNTAFLAITSRSPTGLKSNLGNPGMTRA